MIIIIIMGSCVVKQPKVFPISRYPKPASTVSFLDVDREYLRPEVINGIFMAKDMKTPIIKLEANKLYLMRRSRNEGALEKNC